MEKLRVFTLCSGYDSQCLALKKAGIDFELVGWSEIDKNAIKAHNALFPEYADRNYGDMSKIDWTKVPDFELLTYSTPCTDISQAGARKGLEKGSGTRSSLLWYTEEAIRVKRPKHLLMENVATILGQKYKPSLIKWLDILTDYGYFTAYSVLDSQNFGIPQHRKWFFAVSALSDGSNLTCKSMKFPSYYYEEEHPLREFLTDDADESLYVTGDSILGPHCKGRAPIMNADGVSYVDWGHNFVSRKKSNDTYDNGAYNRVWKLSSYCGTINCAKVQEVLLENGRVRDLSVKESFALMGVDKRDIDTLMNCGLPKSALYKLAGNSIVVPVLVKIFKEMLRDE